MADLDHLIQRSAFDWQVGNQGAGPPRNPNFQSGASPEARAWQSQPTPATPTPITPSKVPGAIVSGAGKAIGSAAGMYQAQEGFNKLIGDTPGNKLEGAGQLALGAAATAPGLIAKGLNAVGARGAASMMPGVIGPIAGALSATKFIADSMDMPMTGLSPFNTSDNSIYGRTRDAALRNDAIRGFANGVRGKFGMDPLAAPVAAVPVAVVPTSDPGAAQGPNSVPSATGVIPNGQPAPVYGAPTLGKIDPAEQAKRDGGAMSLLLAEREKIVAAGGNPADIDHEIALRNKSAAGGSSVGSGPIARAAQSTNVAQSQFAQDRVAQLQQMAGQEMTSQPDAQLPPGEFAKNIEAFGGIANPGRGYGTEVPQARPGAVIEETPGKHFNDLTGGADYSPGPVVPSQAMRDEAKKRGWQPPTDAVEVHKYGVKGEVAWGPGYEINWAPRVISREAALQQMRNQGAVDAQRAANEGAIEKERIQAETSGASNASAERRQNTASGSVANTAAAEHALRRELAKDQVVIQDEINPENGQPMKAAYRRRPDGQFERIKDAPKPVQPVSQIDFDKAVKAYKAQHKKATDDQARAAVGTRYKAQ